MPWARAARRGFTERDPEDPGHFCTFPIPGLPPRQPGCGRRPTPAALRANFSSSSSLVMYVSGSGRGPLGLALLDRERLAAGSDFHPGRRLAALAVTILVVGICGELDLVHQREHRRVEHHGGDCQFLSGGMRCAAMDRACAMLNCASVTCWILRLTHSFCITCPHTPALMFSISETDVVVLERSGYRSIGACWRRSADMLFCTSAERGIPLSSEAGLTYLGPSANCR